MLSSNTHTIAQVLHFDTNALRNVDFKGICTDTRKRMGNTLFIALVGEHFDAHDYINQAENMGAVAIIASKSVSSNLPTILVDNTQTALADLAHWHLKNNNPKVVAITGSNGKTTTKNMLANILSLQAPTLSTKGNLNNHLGVPMTLLELEDHHRYAVIEMGANHLGEIERLRDIACPDVAVVTNTLDAHIGEFGGFENLAKSKGEIYSVDSQNIVNTSTSFIGDMSFGDGGDIFANNICNKHFDLNIFDNKTTVNLQLLGQHNIDNALAASACAHTLGIDIETIKLGLENTQAEKGRLNMINQEGLTIIDDTYNASPQSMIAAIDTLLTFKGEKIAVLGDMAELGNDTEGFHYKIGQLAKDSLDVLYTYGELAKYYGGIHFEDLDKLCAHITASHSQATILIKGSRMVKLDQLVQRLQK